MDRFRDVGKSFFQLMPQAYRETDNGELEDLCEVLEDEVDTWEDLLDAISLLPRPDVCPEAWLEYLAADYGLRLPLLLTEAQKRELVGNIVSIWRRKGDLAVIADVIRIVTSLSVYVFAYWDDPDQWVVGVSEVGVNTQIGVSYWKRHPDTFIAGYSEAGDTDGYARAGDRSFGRDAVWTFQINTFRQPTPRELVLIHWAAKLLKRAEDHYVVYWPGISQYWIIQVSRLGIDTIIGPDYWMAGVSMVGIGTMVGRSAPTPSAATLYGLGVGTVPTEPPNSPPLPTTWFITP